jgi:hypothetical protein
MLMSRQSSEQLVQAVCPGGSIGLDNKVKSLKRQRNDIH